MKIVILSGSPRKGGNTDMLVNAFLKGVKGGDEVEVLRVCDMKIAACVACDYCKKNDKHVCAIKDDVSRFYSALNTADAVVIATPLYFFGASAQLMSAIDRLHNPTRNDFHIKKAALLAVGANGNPKAFDGLIEQFKLTLDFFKIENGGILTVGSVNNKGDIENNSALIEAEKLAANL